MESRIVLPVTLMLLSLSGVRCTPQKSLATPTETVAAPSATALPSSQPPSATAAPTLALVASPSISPTKPSDTRFALNDYKFRLIAQFGVPFYCDPDMYPVARPVSDDQVSQVVATLQKNNQEYEAILRFLGLAGTTNLSAQQKRAVYNEFKLLSSITLEPVADKYNFSLRVGTNDSQGLTISGVIDQNGDITVTKREPTFLTCPRCLTVNTLIDAPQGAILVQDIKRGMMIWTANADGERRVAPVLETIRRPVPAEFPMIHVVLDDGREILVSPHHPTIDGLVIGDLNMGDAFEGARVVSAAHVPYAGGWTYDILPAGETGAYWANGILLKSTLAK